MCQNAFFPIFIHTRDYFIIAVEPGVGGMSQIPPLRNLVLSSLCFWLRLKSFSVVSVTKHHAGFGSEFEITGLPSQRPSKLNAKFCPSVTSLLCPMSESNLEPVTLEEPVMLGKTKPKGLIVPDSSDVLDQQSLLRWASWWWSPVSSFPSSHRCVPVYMVNIRIHKRWYHR